MSDTRVAPQTVGGRRRLRKMKKLLNEPLLHFLLLGGALFLLFGLRGMPDRFPGGAAGAPSPSILVTQNDLDQLRARFVKTWQRPPTEDEVQSLLDEFIRDEILYREAQAAGLDRDDSVVKRRLRMKMEFIFEDIAAIGEPSEADLQAFFQQHREKYRIEPQCAFRHVYVDADMRKEDAMAYADQTLARLRQGADPAAAGDPFVLGATVERSPLTEIGRQFGEGFAKTLPGLQEGQWEGPIQSGFGLHLVQITERRDARLPDLAEVGGSLRTDWATARQQELKNAAYAKMRERYTVEIERPRVPPTAAGSEARTGMAAR